MKKNMGPSDRYLRVLIAGVMVVLYLVDVVGGTLAAVLLSLSGVLVLTAWVGICPLYLPFGLSSCRKA